jgi:hypothetical protein
MPPLCKASVPYSSGTTVESIEQPWLYLELVEQAALCGDLIGRDLRKGGDHLLAAEIDPKHQSVLLINTV